MLEACKNDTCVCWKHVRMRLRVLEACTNETCVIVNLTLSFLLLAELDCQRWFDRNKGVWFVIRKILHVFFNHKTNVFVVSMCES